MDNKTIAELKESGDYDQIFNSYLRMVKKVCRVCNDVSDDSIADGMLGLYKAIESFNPELGVLFSSYSWRSIKWAVMRGIRNRRRPMKDMSILLRNRLVRFSYEEDFTALQDRKRLVNKIRRALDNLLPKYRDIMISVFYEGRTYQNIADELGVSKVRIKQIVDKSLEHLRKWYSLNYFLE